MAVVEDGCIAGTMAITAGWIGTGGELPPVLGLLVLALTGPDSGLGVEGRVGAACKEGDGAGAGGVGPAGASGFGVGGSGLVPFFRGCMVKGRCGNNPSERSAGNSHSSPPFSCVG